MFKRDATPPECGFTLTGTVGWDSWYTTDVGVAITTHSDNLSGVTNNGEAYGTGSLTGDKSFTHSDNTSGVSYTGHIKDEAGNTNTCSTSFKRDVTPPSCTIAKSNTRSTDGVTLSVTCKDGNGPAGCNVANSQTGGSKLANGTYEYTVYDNAGNYGKCSETVYIQNQRADRTCNTASRCPDASAGCETWASCVNDSCDTYACNPYDCNPYSCNCDTCTKCTKTGYCDKAVSASGSASCYAQQGVVANSGTCYVTYECCKESSSYSCNCSTCYNTCYETCHYSCRNQVCGCETYHRDLGKCGCETWNAYGDWYDVASCTSNTNNYVNDNNICRILYY